MGRKFGFSWSWGRATGVSALKGRVSRTIGIPLTRGGRQRKVGRLLGCALSAALIGVVAVVVVISIGLAI